MAGEYPNLSKEELEKAKKEREGLKKKAIYWHNAIPPFDDDTRYSLTKDLQAVTNVEQLELNKKLYSGININNWLSIIISVLNLMLLVVNLYLFFKKT